MLRFKFSDHPEYAKTFGPILAQTIRTYLPGTYDCISWMPVSRETLQKRGYDQAQLLAQEAAKTLGRQAVPLLVKMKSNVPQSSLRERRQRLENVAGVYSVPHPKRVAGQRVLLIDGILLTMVDSRTNFAREISALLRETYGGDIKVFDSEIPHSVRAKETSAEGKSIFAHDPGGKVAEAYGNLTREVLQLEKQRAKSRAGISR